MAAAGPAVAAQVEACVEGTFTDLSAFPAGRFDAVLCLGAAFSHVVDPAARRRTLAELPARRPARRPAVRLRPEPDLPLSRPGAVSVHLGGLGSGASGASEGLAAFAATGLATDADGVPWYAFLPEELVASLAEAGLESLALYGAQGIAAHLPPDNLEALMADPLRWPGWRELLLATCDHPNVVGVSSHLLAVAGAPILPRPARAGPAPAAVPDV